MALERATIIAKALELLDEVGIEGLSNRRLAAELGVKGPSLYWHFKSMADLHSQMAEAMMAQVMPSPDPEAFPGDWREWLSVGAWGLRGVALSRRDGVLILAAARPTSTNPLLSFPAMVARLQAAGFSPEAARGAMIAIGRYVMGSARSENAGSDADFAFGLETLLDGLQVRLARTS
ncbi:TetR/AcrR family transcriptional regulator C-terminal domain-containing protein [Phenylobacterium sp.]|uniref:TetR/AcrR family transcriptional regulator C-terminal domain-containing protein n=1 Tax=Phenylobacterium sp. TaxID=1871053 RepID=UPI0027266295|nr:TetR/AcrR family transcriptional regulator C-terminal domain-containing protein [Phenylobacterium sp.]MDO8379288.1 TetR/AcrR family transcriptional regulator C-terminal domain-containing protein [Phenylobacterium sp.]